MIRLDRFFVRPLLILSKYFDLPFLLMCKGYDGDDELYTEICLDDLDIDFINDEQYFDFQIWLK